MPNSGYDFSRTCLGTCFIKRVEKVFTVADYRKGESTTRKQSLERLQNNQFATRYPTKRIYNRVQVVVSGETPTSHLVRDQRQ